jgi:hypothetical protein
VTGWRDNQLHYRIRCGPQPKSGLIIGDPSDILRGQGAIGIDACHVGIVITKAPVDEVPGVVQSGLVVAEDAHGLEALALVIEATDGGKGGEGGSVGAIPTFGRSVVLSHESSIQDPRGLRGLWWTVVPLALSGPQRT